MPLDPQQVQVASQVTVANSQALMALFETATGGHFIEWFNAQCANRGAWSGKQIGSSQDVKQRFAQFWDAIEFSYGTPSINLLQFAALMSILINEVGATLQPCAELCGRAGHPGLAYAFDEIPGIKRSYNAAGNRLAGDLFFDDVDFWSAHSGLPLANEIRARQELREQWNGTVYPQTAFSTSTDPAVTGFIQQADFYKFRGRGFIQTTWRANYKPLVDFVQNYTGPHEVIKSYQAKWTGLNLEHACTASTTQDWDDLFEKTDLIIPSRAVGLHNAACGNYLGLSADASVLNQCASVPGSFFRMGLKISGGSAYAELFTSRVIQLLNTLNYAGLRPSQTAGI